MVSGSRGGIAARLTALLATALLAAACTQPGMTAATPESTMSPSTTIVTPSTTSSSTTTSSTTSTTTSTTTTTVPATTTTTEDLPDIGARVLIPNGDGPFPAVVLVHGGGWVTGSPDLMDSLARFLTDAGYLTVNTPYTLSSANIAGFPAAVNDVACAVRYAARHPSGDGTVVVVGHSAGAHIGALVALDDGRYGGDCPIDGPGIPDRLVGLAGPYDISRLGPLMFPFFGVSPQEDPDAWIAGNPMNQTDENPGLSSLILSGGADALVDPSFGQEFAMSLEGTGKDVTVEVVDGAQHGDMYNPAWVGDIIVDWLDG